MTMTSRRCVLLVALAVAALSGCGGGGGGDDVAGPPPTPASPTTSLFVADLSNGGHIGILSTLAPPAGSALVARSIGPIPRLSGKIAFDVGRDELYVGSDDSVLVFAGASKAAGSPAPARSIRASGFDVRFNAGVVLDRVRDRLYWAVSEGTGGLLLVFERASSSNGTVVPDRVISVSAIREFAIDQGRSILYVSDSGVQAFLNFDGLSGPVFPTRNVSTTVADGLAIDTTRDVLYLGDFSGVSVIQSASTATNVTPPGRLAVPFVRTVAVDSANDRLYVGASEIAFHLSPASQLVSGPASVPAAAVRSTSSAFAGFAFP